MKSKLAIASLVLGLIPIIIDVILYILMVISHLNLERIVGIDNVGGVGISAGFLLGIPALILGTYSLSAIKKQPSLEGRNLARLGIALGIVSIIIYPVMIIIGMSRY